MLILGWFPILPDFWGICNNLFQKNLSFFLKKFLNFSECSFSRCLDHDLMTGQNVRRVPEFCSNPPQRWICILASLREIVSRKGVKNGYFP